MDAALTAAEDRLRSLTAQCSAVLSKEECGSLATALNFYSQRHHTAMQSVKKEEDIVDAPAALQ